MRPNVANMLDSIDTFMAKGGRDASDLWDILTALRSRDHLTYDDTSIEDLAENLDEKDATVCVLRALVLPKTCRFVGTRADRGWPGRAFPGHRFDLPLERCARPKAGRDHFADHFNNAVEAVERPAGLY